MADNTNNNRSPHHIGKSPIKFLKDDTGKMTIPPQDLNIIWGKDNRYWNIPNNGSDAVLSQVCWLEVTGSVEGIEPEKQYEVCFTVSLEPDAFGFGGCPLYVMVKRGKNGKFAWKKNFLKLDQPKKTQDLIGKSAEPENQGQKSAEPENQDQNSKDASTLHFGLYEVWSGKWKGGLKIKDVVVKELA